MRFSDLPERLREVSGRIDAAVQRGGHGQRVTVIGVTKTHGPDAVEAAFEAGLRDVGENRVQEGEAKIDALAQGLGDELKPAGVHVLVVRPGFVHTQMTAHLDAAPLERFADPGRELWQDAGLIRNAAGLEDLLDFPNPLAHLVAMERQPYGGPPELLVRNVDSGQRRAEIRAERDVVVPGDRDVLRDP